MRFILACIMAIALCFMQGCDKPLRFADTKALHEQLENLRKENEELKKKPSLTQKVIETKEVIKVVEDTTKMMNWFKFIGVVLLGAGAALYAAGFYWTVVKFLLQGLGAGAAACGGTFFAISLTTQLAIGWLPYFLFIALCLVFIGAIVWLARKVDWTPDEKNAVVDLVEGKPDAVHNPIVQDVLKRATKKI
jgi:hypothetical protein